MQKTTAMRILLLLLGSCYIALTLPFSEPLYAQPRKRKVIEPADPAPASVTKGSKPLDAKQLYAKKQQELAKSPDQILNLAISQYQSSNYALAESLLVRYMSLSSDEPLARRELAQLLQVKTLVKMDRLETAKERLSQLRLNAGSAEIRQEADFDAAALDYQDGQFFSAARRFMGVAGTAWSPTDSSALRRRAAMYVFTLAQVFLKRHELIDLLTSTDSPHLAVLLLNALLHRELVRANPALDSLSLLASTLETRYASALSPAYRTMLEGMHQHIVQARSGTVRRFKLGVLLPFSIDIFDSSEQPSLGEKIMLGILQAVAAHHQLAVGSRIDVLIYPCMSDDSLALRSMLNELIERESVHLILGPVYSRQAVHVSRFCAEKGVPMLTPTATDEEITRHITTSFQLNPTYAVRGKAIARFLIDVLGAKTFGVLARDSTYGKFMAEGFREAVLAAGGEMKFYGILPTQIRGIAQVLAPLKLKAHPQKGFPETAIDAVYIPMSDFESIAIAVEQLKFYNIKTRIVGSGDWHDPLLLSQYRSIGDSVIYAIDSHISPDAPETKRVSEAFKAVWGMLPDLQFWFGYDAMDFVVATAVEKGLTDRADIAHAFRNAPPYHGHRSEIFFGGGNINLKMHIMKFQNGTLTKLQ
jgi:ABC-type branched-subunit amino acid transport system substrate-binding protein